MWICLESFDGCDDGAFVYAFLFDHILETLVGVGNHGFGDLGKTTRGSSSKCSHDRYRDRVHPDHSSLRLFKRNDVLHWCSCGYYQILGVHDKELHTESTIT